MDNFTRLLERLTQAEIEFVLVGGLAALLHGSAMVTRDVDVCAKLDSDSITKLRTALAQLRPVHRMTANLLPFADHPKEVSALKNLYLSTSLGILDILGEIKAIGNFEATKAQSEIIEVEGVKIRILTLEALIRTKESVARPRDIQAAKELRAIAALRGIPVPPPPSP